MAIGRKTGGRIPGSKNKTTLEREALAMQAAMDAAKVAKITGNMQRDAIGEMNKALILAEGMAKAYQPIMERDANGKITLKGGDHTLFKEWTKIWVGIQSELAQYQRPKMKATEAPTPAPDPAEIERLANSPPRKRITLRIFEGGKLISGPADPKKTA